MLIVDILFRYILLFVLFFLVACSLQKYRATEAEAEDEAFVDSILSDSSSLFLIDEEYECAYVRENESFEEFLFSFSNDEKYQLQCIQFPFLHVTAFGDSSFLKRSQWTHEFSFLQQEFYTILYSSLSQIDEVKNSTRDSVVVENIDLENHSIHSYYFLRRQGRWNLISRRDSYLQQSDIGNFLVFYRHFSSDSIFQQSCIHQPLHFSMIDTEDEMQLIEGSIDASQWFSFCPEVPNRQITNIRFGQTYQDAREMILQKCGQGNGLMEIFTFRQHNGSWNLMSYEN